MSRPTKPGNLERGWNDPPMFVYSSASPNQTASSRQPLTKRVAYPGISSGPNAGAAAAAPANASVPNLQPQMAREAVPGLLMQESTTFQNVQLLPPAGTADPPQFHAPVIVPTMTSASSSGDVPTSPLSTATNPMCDLPVAPSLDNSSLQIPNFNDDEQMYHYVITRLQRALKECQEIIELRIVDEMRKKVNIFSDMWKNGKISYPVKSTMAQLATAIHRRRCDIAHELHLELMMNHVSEVSKWLVGIKRLIHEIEKVQEPMSPSASCIPDRILDASEGSQEEIRGSSGSNVSAECNNEGGLASTAQEETNSDGNIGGVDNLDLLLNDTGNVNQAGHQVGEFPENVDLPMIHPLPVYPVNTAEDFFAENLRRCSAADDGEQHVVRDVNCDPDSNIDRDDQSVQDRGDRDHGVQDRDHGVQDRDHCVQDRDHGVQDRDHGVQDRDHGVQDRDHGVQDRDHGVQDRDHGVQDRDHVVQDRDDNQNSLEKAHKSENPLHDESISEIANADVITTAVAPVDISASDVVSDGCVD